MAKDYGMHCHEHTPRAPLMLDDSPGDVAAPCLSYNR